MTVVALLLFLTSAVLTALTVAAPESIERGYGYIRAATQSVEATMTTELPHVRLGGAGGMELVNRCDGTFSEMVSYRSPETIPVYAAHNNCGGDIIHPWKIGQQVRVEGRDQVYEVIDLRDIPKREGTVKDIVGLHGEFALQTCYYGVDKMKFIGLAPAPAK